MPRARPDPVPASRYSRALIGAEIRQEIARRQERGLHSRIAEHLGMSSQQLSHRLSGKHELSIEMCGAIADRLDAPYGWPFVTYEVARKAFAGPQPTHDKKPLSRR